MGALFDQHGVLAEQFVIIQTKQAKLLAEDPMEDSMRSKQACSADAN